MPVTQSQPLTAAERQAAHRARRATDSVRLNVWLPAEAAAALKMLAAGTGRTQADIVAELLLAEAAATVPVAGAVAEPVAEPQQPSVTPVAEAEPALVPPVGPPRAAGRDERLLTRTEVRRTLGGGPELVGALVAEGALELVTYKRRPYITHASFLAHHRRMMAAIGE